MQREPLYNAILAELQQLQGPQYVDTFPDQVHLVVSRGFVSWDEATIQPAIYLVPITEKAQYNSGLPTKWLVTAELWVYVRADTIAIGVQNLSMMLDAIDSILSPLGANAGPQLFVNTLGGLAVYCAIQGAIEISGGFLNGQQAVARVPLEIMVA